METRRHYIKRQQMKCHTILEANMYIIKCYEDVTKQNAVKTMLINQIHTLRAHRSQGIQNELSITGDSPVC